MSFEPQSAKISSAVRLVHVTKKTKWTGQDRTV